MFDAIMVIVNGIEYLPENIFAIRKIKRDNGNMTLQIYGADYEVCGAMKKGFIRYF